MFKMLKNEMFKIFVFGIFMGVLISVLVVWTFSTKQISDAGITVLTNRDNAVITVPKNSVIDGDACQMIDSDDNFIVEKIKTPYVTKGKMMIRCDQKEGAICTIYLSDEYGPDYFRDVVTKKILK